MDFSARINQYWVQVAGIVKCVPSEADEIGGADATRGAFSWTKSKPEVVGFTHLNIYMANLRHFPK